jgi:hypothetical protein
MQNRDKRHGFSTIMASQGGQGGREVLGKGRSAMVARVLIYFYLVLLGISFLMEQAPIAVAVGP